MTIKNMTLYIINMICALSLAACQPSVLQKLKNQQIDVSLNGVFWANLSKENSALWQVAKSYCEAHAEKPNCGSSKEYTILTSGSTTLIPYGMSGETL